MNVKINALPIQNVHILISLLLNLANFSMELNGLVPSQGPRAIAEASARLK